MSSIPLQASSGFGGHDSESLFGLHDYLATGQELLDSSENEARTGVANTFMRYRGEFPGRYPEIMELERGPKQRMQLIAYMWAHEDILIRKLYDESYEAARNAGGTFVPVMDAEWRQERSKANNATQRAVRDAEGSGLTSRSLKIIELWEAKKRGKVLIAALQVWEMATFGKITVLKPLRRRKADSRRSVKVVAAPLVPNPSPLPELATLAMTARPSYAPMVYSPTAPDPAAYPLACMAEQVFAVPPVSDPAPLAELATLVMTGGPAYASTGNSALSHAPAAYAPAYAPGVDVLAYMPSYVPEFPLTFQPADLLGCWPGQVPVDTSAFDWPDGSVTLDVNSQAVYNGDQGDNPAVWESDEISGHLFEPLSSSGHDHLWPSI